MTIIGQLINCCFLTEATGLTVAFIVLGKLKSDNLPLDQKNPAPELITSTQLQKQRLSGFGFDNV